MPDDINGEIDRELEIAKARWGNTFELKCLEGSRGDTLSDEDVLRSFTTSPTRDGYSRVIAKLKP